MKITEDITEEQLENDVEILKKAVQDFSEKYGQYVGGFNLSKQTDYTWCLINVSWNLKFSELYHKAISIEKF